SFYLLALFNAISLSLSVVFVGSFLRVFSNVIRQHWRHPRLAFQSSPQVVFTGMFLCLPNLILMFSGAPCFPRYAIVQYPLLFALPALFLVKARLTRPWRQLILGGVAVTMAFNIILAPAFFHQQGWFIEHADY